MKSLLTICLLLSLIGLNPATAQQELPEGISLLEDRGLELKLQDARAYLAENRWEEAVSLLQEVADADPSAVIAYSHGLFYGAAYSAGLLLAELPPEAQAFRQQILGNRGHAELAEALSPPDLVRLTAIAHHYRNTTVGNQATAALRELWRDRGYQDIASQIGAAPLPPDWQAVLPMPAPADAMAAPTFSTIGAAELPRLDANALQPSWHFSFDDASALQHLNHRMAFGYGLGFATNGREVVALELGSGLPRWHFRGPAGWSDIDTNLDQTMSDGASSFTLLAPVLADGILLAVIQEPVPIGRADNYIQIDIRKMMPARRLYAFDALSGEILWRQKVRWMDAQDRQPFELAASPPAIAGGKVYLPVYSASGTVDLSLLCLDLRTGKQLWKSFLTSGTMETNLFGNILSELACPPPIATLERVFICTHFGTVCAVDAQNGQAIWTRTYRRTEVKTRQSGIVSPRTHYFRNNPLAFDNQVLVAAPLDSFFALAIDTQDGRLLDSWQAVSDSTYGTMAHLIGLDRLGAWFSGTHVVHQPFSASRSSRLQFSKALYSYPGRDSSNLSPGAITHDGIVAMSERGALILDPDTLLFQGFAVDRQQSPYIPLGPVQAIHGMLMFMTHDGITAMLSLESLLDALAARNLDTDTLHELLFMLESVNFTDYDSGLSLGKRLARTAELLASESKFATFAEDLIFLASRTWLLVGKTNHGLKQLEKLLRSGHTRLRLAAASLILDVQAEVDPLSETIGEAILILLEEAPQQVLTRNGSYQPFLASLERAEALAAMAKRNPLQQHQQLIDVLLLENVGDLNVRETPLQDWARRMLDSLLKVDEVAQTHQQAALAKLQTQPVSQASLRAFADTSAMQNWLRTQLDLSVANRKQYKQLLRWVYEFGARDRAWPEVAAQVTAQPSLPTLPQELRALSSMRLDDVWLLHMMARGEAVFAFLQAKNKNLCHIVRIDRDGAKLLHSLPFFPSAERLKSLLSYCYPTDTGLALVVRGRWVHISPDGNYQTRLLNYTNFNVTRAMRVGELAAVLLRGENQMLRLELLDLQTGVSVMTHNLDAPADRVATLVANERWLFVLLDKSRVVRRIDLHHQSPPTLFDLPFVLSYDEMLKTQAFGDGIAFQANKSGARSRSSRGSGSVVIVRPGKATTTLPLTNLEFGNLPTATGIGWWSRPSRSLQSTVGPLTLNWLEPGATRPWKFAFPTSKVRVPRITTKFRAGEVPRQQQLLTIQPAANGRVELHCLELGASAERWTSTISHLAYAALSDPFSAPLRATNGWALLLRETNNRRQGTRLHTFLLDNHGGIVASYVTSSASSNRYGQEIYLLDNFLVLRNGDLLTLLGKP